MGRTFLNVLDLRVPEGAEASISDSATDTLKTGNEERYLKPTSSRKRERERGVFIELFES